MNQDDERVYGFNFCPCTRDINDRMGTCPWRVPPILFSGRNSWFAVCLASKAIFFKFISLAKSSGACGSISALSIDPGSFGEVWMEGHSTTEPQPVWQRSPRIISCRSLIYSLHPPVDGEYIDVCMSDMTDHIHTYNIHIHIYVCVLH